MQLYLIAIILAYYVQGNTATCPRGWIEWQTSCYLFHNDGNAFDEGELVCKADNSHLVAFETADEITAVTEILKKKDTGFDYYIGLTDKQKEGEYRWRNTDTVSEVSNWRSGEPSGGQNSNCVVIDNDNFKWKSKSCRYFCYLICERVATPPGKKNYRFEATQVWNSLPNQVRTKTDFNEFKRLIRTWSGFQCNCSMRI